MRANYIEKMLRVIVEKINNPYTNKKDLEDYSAKAMILLDRDANRAASVMRELDNNQL